MMRALRMFAASIAQQRLRARVTGALQVNRRGGVPNDALKLKRLRNRIEVEWEARGTHPWDKSLPSASIEKRFVQQCLGDVDAALSRLFATLPDVDDIELRVLDPKTGDPIVAGSVNRAEAELAMPRPVGMKLKSLGLIYRLANWRFESLRDQ